MSYDTQLIQEAPSDKLVSRTMSRDELVAELKCSHGELGRLLRAKQFPLPVRFDGVIFWWRDEVQTELDNAQRKLERYRKR